MVCEICGVEIDHSGQFCRMCGSKIREPVIHKKELSRFLQEKLDGTDITAEDKVKYQDIINRMNSSQFKEVEVYKSTFDEEFIEDLIGGIITEKDDGTIQLHVDTKESFLKLSAAYLFSEMESFHNEIEQLNMEIHNDRIAKLNSATTLYKRALLTEDIGRRREELDRAAGVCSDGLEALKKEIESRLDFFSKLPKSTIKKIFFHGFSIKAARGNLKQIQEAYKMYCNGVQLLLAIDIENGEPEKILVTAENEGIFLGKMYRAKGYKRVLEIDDENAIQWKEHRSGLAVVLHSAKQCIEADHLSIKILEDR